MLSYKVFLNYAFPGPLDGSETNFLESPSIYVKIQRIELKDQDTVFSVAISTLL